MTIWEAFCDSNIRTGYSKTLVAKGETPTYANDVKEKFSTYLNRLKIFNKQLNECSSKEEIKTTFEDIFYNKWQNHIIDRYKDMPGHFFSLLDYLDVVQAISGNYFTEDAKNRIEGDIQFPLEKLTDFELLYIKNGKLTALLNPQLLFLMRKSIITDVVKVKEVSLLCKSFYGNLLPDMKPSDYSVFIKKIWTPGKKVKKNSNHSKVHLVYKDGKEEILGVMDSLMKLVQLIGPQKVLEYPIQLRGEPLVVRNIPYGKDKLFLKIPDTSLYLNNSGATKERISVMNIICKHFGTGIVARLK